MSCPTAHEWERIVAAETPPEERERAERHASDCPDCARTLEELRRGEGLLAGLRHALDDAPPLPPEPDAGTLIGEFRLVRRLGEGGMGVVWEAEQSSPRRRVALKLIRAGALTPAAARRFQREIQLAGRLDHPGVARVFHAGSFESPSGPQPYFAMDLVQGQPLTRHAESGQLDVRGRLELFVRVARAVQHAHELGVIHRDLKPGNILVTDDGQPKVLDFGVARAAGGDEGPVTEPTMAGQLVGTLRYMSPEQVTGESALVGTRSDVYTLGVILFELLTGRLPYDVDDKSVPELVRVIREDEPAAASAEVRGLAGDVDTILAKALEKTAARRYPSAAALADDVDRYLRDEPIMARPPSALYQLRKLARRHRVGVAAITGALLALVAGIVTTSVQAHRARRAEKEAVASQVRAGEAAALADERRRAVEDEIRRVEAVNDFLKYVLIQGDPHTGAREASIRDVLARAADRVEGRFAEDPEIEVMIRETIGGALAKLGDYEAADRHNRRVVELLEAHRPAGHPDLAGAYTSRAMIAMRLARYDEAERWGERAVEIARARPESATAELGMTLHNLALLRVRQSRFREAEPLYRESLDTYARLGKADSIFTAIVLTNLGRCLTVLRESAEAERLLRRALEIKKRRAGADHPYVASACVALADVLRSTGHDAEAEEHARAAVAIRRERLGPGPALSVALQALAHVLVARDRYEDAVPVLEEAARGLRERLPPDHPQPAEIDADLGYVLFRSGRGAEGGRLLAPATRALRRAFGPRHATFVRAAWLRAQQMFAGGDIEATEELCERVVDEAGSSRLVLQWVARLRIVLGAALAAQDDPEGAEEEMLGALATLEGAGGRGSRYALCNLVDLYEQSGQDEKAAPLRARLRAESKP